MRITRQLEDLQLEPKPVVMGVGSFDGVHRGHQEVFRTILERAADTDSRSWVLTFDPHPLKVLAPEAAPPLITSTEHKLHLMDPFEMDGCVVMDFTRALASEEPEAFLSSLLQRAPQLKELVVGENWTFGHGGRGNVTLLKQLAVRNGLRVTVVDPFMRGDRPVSSTRVRKEIAEGNLDEAREMLGRQFSILGTVVSGKQIGTRMGFPTANLDPHNEVRPPSGVYAAEVSIHSRLYMGAAFLADVRGAKQSPSGSIVEVHLLDFDEDLYGEDIEVSFIRRMRSVESFESRRLLAERIARDVNDIRELLDHLWAEREAEDGAQ